MEIIKPILPQEYTHARFWSLLCVIFLCTGRSYCFAQSSPNEYQVKAVFIYNFTQFIQWPKSAFEDDNSPFIIGVVGEKPLYPYLTEAVEGEAFNQRPYLIEYYKNVSEINKCHILYIGESGKSVADEILRLFSGKATLIISDIGGISSIGGDIEFIKSNNKIRIAINPEAVNKSGLKISSKLLRLAKIVSATNETKIP